MQNRPMLPTSMAALSDDFFFLRAMSQPQRLQGNNKYHLNGKSEPYIFRVFRVPEMTDRDLRELPLLTFGSQLQGSHNTRIGEVAMKDVFLTIADILDKYIVERGAKKLVVRNSTGRLVSITRSSDPDVSIVESIGQQVHHKVAIEVKGGLDVSNVHNRAGEAEKSHLKAKAKQYKDFWTIISKKRIPMEKLRAESQTTTEWFDLGELLAHSGSDWEDFRAKLTGAVGIPLLDTPKSK